jgi:hypothetical protein
MKAGSVREIVRLSLVLAAVVGVGGFDHLPVLANSPPDPTPRSIANEEQVGGVDSSSPPRTFKGVRYRPAMMQGPSKFLRWVATGTLTIGADAIIFESKKIKLTIPVSNIWSVSSLVLSNDPIRWMVVQYDEAGSLKGAGFEEAQHMFAPDDYDAIWADLRLAESRSRSEPASVWSQRALGTGADEGLVEMRHYSFQIPKTGGWTVERPGGPFEEAVLTKLLYGDAGHVQIKILRNQIFSPTLVKASAQKNADAIRNGEKQTMLREGVRRGLYQLHDVSMDEVTISEKHFYFMDYTTETSTDLEPSSLYLFFPHERDNTSFIMVVYTAVLAKRPGAIDNSKPDLKSVLNSLELKSVN